MNILLIEPNRAKYQEFKAWLHLKYGDIHTVTALEEIDVYDLSGGATSDSSQILPELFKYCRTFDFTMSRVSAPVKSHEEKRMVMAPVGIGLLGYFETVDKPKIALLSDVNANPTDQIWLPLGQLLHSKLTIRYPGTTLQSAPQNWSEVFLESLLYVLA